MAPAAFQSHPLVYEINTRCWLRDLSEQAGAPITLANVPETELADWRRLGFTHIWLMGVWHAGPKSRAHSLSLRQPGQPLQRYDEQDIVGSAYAIASYRVSEALGGNTALKVFRERLAAFGLKLLLDFVPNHTGLDHAWLAERPELFVQSGVKKPGTFRPSANKACWIAHGRDPYFHPWVDTAQLDYRNAATRRAMIEQLKSVAQRCDGARCDMSMLVLNDVFQKTWAQFPVSLPCPATQFWAEAIPAVKELYPDFTFMAEVYWDLEPRLQELGFDYTYDKRWHDHLVARRPDPLQRHLLEAAAGDLRAGVHFLENHDEARIASFLPWAEHRPAALALMGSPGMRLLHEGQLRGATQRVSIHVNHRPREAPNEDIAAFYERLLGTLPGTSVGKGDFKVLKPASAWPENPTARNILLVQWQSQPAEFDLVVANFAPHPSQCHAPLQVEGQCDWEMTNLLGDERFERSGRDLRRGLYLDLPPYGSQLFHFSVR